MFSCFGYPKNIVSPIEDYGNNSEIIKGYFDNQKCIYISIEGMGTPDGDSCRDLHNIIRVSNGKVEYTELINKYEYVGYESKSIILDLISAFNNLKSITDNEGLGSITLGKERLKRLEATILKSILNFPEHKIVLIGTSHGSIILHGAIVKLKMISNPLVSSALKERVYVWTLGSPRYLPYNLLTPTGTVRSTKLSSIDIRRNVFNVYNIKDPIVKILQKIMKGRSYIKVPKFPQESLFIKQLLIGNFTNLNVNLLRAEGEHRYFYDSSKALLFVNGLDEHLKIRKPYGNIDIPSIPKYHASLFNFFPFTSYFVQFNLNFKNFFQTNISDEKYDYIVKKCNVRLEDLEKPSPPKTTNKGGGAKKKRVEIKRRSQRKMVEG